MRRIALIPARGGSKRLPRKNIADFLGRPIIAWTIDAARQAGLFADIVVSTEDKEIAAAAKDCGARVDWRPPELAGDSSTVVDVCLNFLDAEKDRNRSYDILCCLYATAPLRTAADIRRTVELVDLKDCHSALAATTYGLPPHQALKINDSRGGVSPMWPELLELRAAEIGSLVVDNGSTYAAGVGALRKTKSFYGPDMKAHVMPRERSVDIDEAVDLDMALFFAQKMKEAT